MKFLAVALLCVVAVAALPEAAVEHIPILRHDLSRSETGEYMLDVETGDGTAISQRGSLTEGEDGPVVVVSGSFTYLGSDGHQYTVHYTADELGFHPQAAHLPVA